MTGTPKTRWKPRIVLAAVGIVGLVMLCLSIGKMRERKEFVAKAVDGYRFRCTLSTDWKFSKEWATYSTGAPNTYFFTPTPSPVRDWIERVFHPSPSKSKFPTIGTVIMMEIDTAKSNSKTVLIQAGFPEMKGQRAATHILAERHLRVDGCPATVVRWEGGASNFRMHGTALLVYQADNGNTYIVAGLADDKAGDRTDREMEGIIASFHVGKVSPAGGKRSGN